MDITVQELKEKFENNSEFVFIDVREVWENEQFNLGGQIIPIGEFMSRIPELEPHKNNEIVVYCHSGNRSGMAKMLLESAGFSNVRNLIGGVVHWQHVYK